MTPHKTQSVDFTDIQVAHYSLYKVIKSSWRRYIQA